MVRVPFERVTMGENAEAAASTPETDGAAARRVCGG
jgi:hypothetical protein